MEPDKMSIGHSPDGRRWTLMYDAAAPISEPEFIAIIMQEFLGIMLQALFRSKKSHQNRKPNAVGDIHPADVVRNLFNRIKGKKSTDKLEGPEEQD